VVISAELGIDHEIRWEDKTIVIDDDAGPLASRHKFSVVRPSGVIKSDGDHAESSCSR